MGGAGLKVMHEEFRSLQVTWHHSEFPGVFGELTFSSQMGLDLGGSNHLPGSFQLQVEWVGKG